MSTYTEQHSAEIERLARGIASCLAPFLAGLTKGSEGPEASALAAALWSALGPSVQKDVAAREAARALALAPDDADCLTVFAIHLKRLVSTNGRLASALSEVVRGRQAELSPVLQGGFRDVLGREDRLLERLELVYLLRSGKAADSIAREARTDVGRLFRLNRRFSLAGATGLVSEVGGGGWLERLDGSDPVLRRLDMVYLVRSGTPVEAVAREYEALPEYVERISARFSEKGLPGILTEEEIDRLCALLPGTVRVVSYNIHGTHGDGDQATRLRRIAREVSRVDPHAAALQEVISGGGIEDTAVRLSAWASSMTGYHYRSRFAYCHQFMEKYPEGIALSTRCREEAAKTIDLTRLPGGLRPSLARNALAVTTEVPGRRAVFTSVHLDHGRDPAVRLAQVEKLVRELAEGPEGRLSIVAGDFNDVEDSPAVRCMISSGYVDAYRARRRDEGNTYPAGGPTMRIDYIFVKGHSEVVSSGLLLDDPELSDHIGVFAEIR